MDLFGDSPEPEAPAININESYANRFQHNHERAELHRLQEKYGAAAADILAGRRQADEDEDFDEDDDDDSSDDETEDEEGEQVTAEVDAAILRTLAKIRSGDADIYDSEKRVFDEEKALAAASALLPKATKDRVAASSSSGKKVTLADYQRSRLRDLMKNSEDPALALAEATTSTTRQDEEMYGEEERHQPLSHVQEQEQLRKQVTQAFHTMGDDGEEAADGFFTRKDDADEDGDPEAYRKYLLANLGSKKAEQAVREALRYQAAEASREAAAAAGPSSAPADRLATTAQADASATKTDKKQRKSTKSQEQTNEDFLMNYVLNRGWMDKPHAAPKLARRPPPTRKEEATKGDDDRGAPAAAGPASNGAERDWEAEAAQLSDIDDAEDSDFDNRAEAFEQAFNFRYEAMEAGAAPAQVTSYARGKDAQQNSVRRVEDKRKREREERKARKEEEKRQKREELDRLRDLKRGQLREKLKQLKEAAGSANVDFDVEKLEGDFDAEEHDRMMAVFGDAYYDEEGDDYGPDDFEGGKPSWADDIDIDDILADEEREEEEAGGKKKKGSKKDKKRAAAAADMDVDGDDEDDAEGDQKLSKKERKKLKKKAKRAEKLGAAAAGADGEAGPSASASSSSSALPQTDAERRAIATRLIDEYRDLDYEDVIGGDLPTRFHYTQVPKVNYGMSAVEILLADDKDLNDVVGLKQMQPYRRGGGLEGAASKRSKELNRRLKEFRRKLDRGEEDLGAAALEGRVAGGAGGKRKRREDGQAAVAAGEDGQQKSEQQPVKKRMGKKERQKLKAAAEAQAAGATGAGAEVANGDSAAPTAAAEVPAQPNGSEEKESKEEKRRRKEEKKARKQAKAEAEAGEAPQAKKVKLDA